MKNIEMHVDEMRRGHTLRMGEVGRNDMTMTTFGYFQTQVNLRWPQKSGWTYPLLGLAGETGELVEEFKKSMRSGEGMDVHRRNRIKLEMGDVLHYLSRLATEMGFTMEEIAEANLVKTENMVGNTKGAP